MHNNEYKYKVKKSKEATRIEDIKQSQSNKTEEQQSTPNNEHKGNILSK